MGWPELPEPENAAASMPRARAERSASAMKFCAEMPLWFRSLRVMSVYAPMVCGVPVTWPMVGVVSVASPPSALTQ